MEILLIYLLLINIVAFITYGIDKWKAKKHRWRIPESTLILLAALGGSVGAWIAMRTFRHKTKHALFYIGVPAILILEVGLACYLYIR